MTPVYNFAWRGVDAYAVHGVCTMEICSTVIAERRDSTEVVAGRSGLVHNQDGAVEEVERKLTLYLPYEQGGSVSDVKDIRKWLKGYGKLTLSTVPGRYMLAYITDQIALDPIVQGFADIQGEVIFRCLPYLYHTDAADITLTSNAIVTNPGDAESAPVITVNATGDVDLMIGEQTVLLTGLTGQIILDGIAEEAYTLDTDGSKLNANSLMGGDFPLLAPGNNAVSWSAGEGGSVTSIVITPNWRDED